MHWAKQPSKCQLLHFWVSSLRVQAGWQRGMAHVLAFLPLGWESWELYPGPALATAVTGGANERMEAFSSHLSLLLCLSNK